MNREQGSCNLMKSRSYMEKLLILKKSVNIAKEKCQQYHSEKLRFASFLIFSFSRCNALNVYRGQDKVFFGDDSIVVSVTPKGII